MDEAQEKPGPGPPREVPARDDVHVVGSPVRCPFCHEDVAVEGEWSACSRCLARHHEACWTEGGRCGACAHDGAVRHERPPSRSKAPPLRRPLAVLGVVSFVAVAALLLSGLAISWRVSAGRERAERAEQEARLTEQEATERWLRDRPSRYELNDALVVEDGRGNFVAVVENEDAVVFGLGAVLLEVKAQEVVVRDDTGPRSTPRPLMALTVFGSAPSSVAHFGRRELSAGEVAAHLRETPPSELDVEELLRRVRGD